jgi:hypothetical protein
LFSESPESNKTKKRARVQLVSYISSPEKDTREPDSDIEMFELPAPSASATIMDDHGLAPLIPIPKVPDNVCHTQRPPQLPASEAQQQNAGLAVLIKPAAIQADPRTNDAPLATKKRLMLEKKLLQLREQPRLSTAGPSSFRKKPGKFSIMPMIFWHSQMSEDTPSIRQPTVLQAVGRLSPPPAATSSQNPYSKYGKSKWR